MLVSLKTLSKDWESNILYNILQLGGLITWPSFVARLALNWLECCLFQENIQNTFFKLDHNPP